MQKNANEGPRGRGHRRGHRMGRRTRRKHMMRRSQYSNDRVVHVEVERPSAPTEEELAFLEDYAREVTEDLAALRQRMDQLKGAGQGGQ